MPAVKQFVRRGAGITIVEIEVLVMQLVKPVAREKSFTPELDKIKTRVRRRRANSHEETEQDNDYRVYRHEPEQDEYAEIDQVLEWVH